MSYGFYKVLHLSALFGVFMSLGALSLHYMNHKDGPFLNKRWTLILHGIGMLIVFVAGFGLMARIGITTPWPLWIYLKMLVWLVIGAMPFLIKRSNKNIQWLWLGTIMWGALAAFLANFKPV